MGFLGRLFGSKDSNTSDNAQPANAGMVFRTASDGGYDMQSVLTAVNALSQEMVSVGTARIAKEKGEPYEIPPLTTAKKGGFEQSDVNAYINELQKKIEELRSQL